MKLHVYEEIYEEARKAVQNLIQKEENEEKLRKTRKRIKTLRTLGNIKSVTFAGEMIAY